MHFKVSTVFSVGIASRKFSILSFALPLFLRVLPEIIMGKYITGFDTLNYYVPVTSRWSSHGVDFFEFVGSAPLFYVLLIELTSIGVPLTISLKILPPILHGLLGFIVYLYSRKVLTWSDKKSFFASCLATLYFVALRFSWDMLRNELGIIFLFVFLIILHSKKKACSWKSFGLLSIIMIFVALSHQLATVIMFVILFVNVVQKLFTNEHAVATALALAASPAFFLFSLMVYAELFVFSSGENGEWLSLFGFSSHLSMLTNTFGFLLFCYLPIMPLMLIGLKHLKRIELKVWFYWCLVAVFLAIILPGGLASFGYRWLLMLFFPIAFFSTEGFKRLNASWKKIIGVILGFLSFSFVFLPAEAAFPYFRVFPYYVPSSMLQNSVPLRDCGDVVNALSWVENNADSNGILLVHDAFHGWALLYLKGNSKIVCYGYENPERVAWEMFRNGYAQLFLVWWVPGEGWHGLPSLPSCFVEVFRSNRIAVYAYNNESMS